MIIEITGKSILKGAIIGSAIAVLCMAGYWAYESSASPLSPLVITIVATGVSIVSALIAFRQQRLSQNVLPLGSSAKLWDRQNDLDKLLILNPATYREFMARSRLVDAFFYAKGTPRDDLYYQLKGLTYLHLIFLKKYI